MLLARSGKGGIEKSGALGSNIRDGAALFDCAELTPMGFELDDLVAVGAGRLSSFFECVSRLVGATGNNEAAEFSARIVGLGLVAGGLNRLAPRADELFGVIVFDAFCPWALLAQIALMHAATVRDKRKKWEGPRMLKSMAYLLRVYKSVSYLPMRVLGCA